MRRAHFIGSAAVQSADPAGTALAAGSTWKTLYIVGGIAALISAAMTVLGVVTFVVWPPPAAGGVSAWFALFQENWLVGMLGLDLVMLVAYLANIPMLLALAVALRRGNEALVALATTLGLVAIASYLASSRLFEMLALSQQYALATTEAQRATLIAAGQSMLTTYLGAFGGPAPVHGWIYQGTAFNVGFALWCVAGVLLSLVMLRNASFGKAAGYAGIAGNAAALGLFAPVIGIALSLLSLPLSLVWYLLIARGLLRRASPAGP